jgi:two-component system, OmpR family, response regulator RegX3
MANAPARILVVEDEPAIRAGLCDVLAYHGHEPVGVEDGDQGLSRALSEEFALVVLDVMLPGVSGLEVCARLRERRPRQAILMLTARGAEADVLEGFRRGADDYVTKPFSVAELVARVGALLRRTSADDSRALAPFRCADLQVDPARGVAARDGAEIELTPREVALLALFASEPGRIVSRRRLLRDVWGMHAADSVETRTVDVHIAKLRKKLGASADAPIETIRGLGYRWVADS